MLIALAMCGFGGLAYGAIVICRACRQTYYKPDREDWLWHALLPCSFDATLTMMALFLRTIGLVAMFLIGASALGLLLIGIHNAWDTVTHIVVKLDGDAMKTESAREEPDVCVEPYNTKADSVPK